MKLFGNTFQKTESIILIVNLVMIGIMILLTGIFMIVYAFDDTASFPDVAAYVSLLDVLVIFISMIYVIKGFVFDKKSVTEMQKGIRRLSNHGILFIVYLSNLFVAAGMFWIAWATAW